MSEKENFVENKQNETIKHNKISDRYKYNRGNLASKLLYGSTIISLLHEEIQLIKIMDSVGYDQGKIAAFTTVYETALKMVLAQNSKQTDCFNAHLEFKNLFAQSKDELRYLCKVAKIALRNDPQKIDKLKLNTKRGVSIADVFTFMENVYSQILNDSEILDLLSAFNYKKERISAFYSNYIATREAYKNYCTISSEAIESTRVRDLKMAELTAWMMDYYTLSKVAHAQRADLADPESVK